MRLKYADRMANNVDPDQTAPRRSSLIWVCNVCTDLFVPILKMFTVGCILVVDYKEGLLLKDDLNDSYTRQQLAVETGKLFEDFSIKMKK